MYRIIFLIFLTLLDLFTKQLVFSKMNLNNFIYVNSFFDLVHIHNFGISFGLFSGVLPPWFFILVSFVIIIFLIFLYLNSSHLIEKWGYIFILSGASGNIIDRSINGYVIDFIYLHFNEFYWPAFNFADIYISIGVFIIVLQIFTEIIKKYKR